MFKVLVKRQFAEWFRGYFYSAKKNKMRSKAGIVAYFILFFMIMVVMLGGMFSSLSFTLCGPLCENDLGWMYFLMLGGISIVLGAFGSVFNTFSALYLSKDNDLLLSLPIPVRDIVAARLVSVYLMGTMYEAAVFIPAIIVYCIVNGIKAEALICEVWMFFIISFIILFLSCVLGWCVARISLKLKNKNIVTVIVSLLFIGGYYFFYFRASGMIRDDQGYPFKFTDIWKQDKVRRISSVCIRKYRRRQCIKCTSFHGCLSRFNSTYMECDAKELYKYRNIDGKVREDA